MPEINMAKIIDGKQIAKELRREIKSDAIKFFDSHARKPKLAVILVGSDPASCIYVNNKQKACEKAEIAADTIRLDENTLESELLELIDKLNADETVDGILVQLPLPKHINEKQVLKRISPDKDVDGFHPVNAGKLLQGAALLEPCTPKGCMELIHSTGTDVCGLNAVVVGRSNLVGKPLMLMLLRENATVTLCHSKTKNLAEICKNADILVAATGRPKLIGADMIKPGAVVIDVGINRLDDGSICGDVEFEGASKISSYITPVPGGVGPMTIAMLLKNTLLAAEAKYA